MNEQTLLITGGCGYLGAHLLRQIAAQPGLAGATVRILDNLSSGSVNALLDLPQGPRYTFIEGDILSPGAVRMALAGVTTVIHLAAIVRTPFAFDQPASVQQVNHWGTVRLLEHCREAGVRRFIHAGSASVYGPGEGFAETSSCHPVGPYSCAKLEADRAALAANGPELATTVLRLATLYGGDPAHVRFDAVANRLVYLSGTGRSLTVFGTGGQARPLVHVRDAARGLLWVLDKEEAAGEVYNLVEENVRIEPLARLIKDLRPQTRVRYTDQDYREHLSLTVAGDKLRAAGWRPRERLAEGLAELLGHFGNLAPATSGGWQTDAGEAAELA
jgi:nucleoside-diphosphate-sugar epimerase